MSFCSPAWKSVVRAAVAALVGAGALSSAHGQSAGAYLKIEGTNTPIYGESTTPGYERWIPLMGHVYSTFFDPTSDFNSSIAYQDGGAVKSIMGNIGWFQKPGAASSAIDALLADGTIIPRLTIDAVNDGPLGAVTLSHTVAVNVSLQGSFTYVPDVYGVMGVHTALSTTWWELDSSGLRVLKAFSEGFTGALPGGAGGFGPGNLNPVPEPHAWMFLVAGLATLGAFQQFRQWRSAGTVLPNS